MSRTLFLVLCVGHFLTTVQAEANIELLQMYSTHGCSADYLVPQRDYFFARFRLSGNDSDNTYELFEAPHFDSTPVNGITTRHCRLLDDPATGFCDDLAVYTNNICSCEEEAQHVYIVSVNLTITSVRFSQMQFNVRWLSANNSINLAYTLPRVEASCPEASIEPIQMNSTHSCSEDYLVPQRDYFFAKFRLSGNDSNHTYIRGPEFGYTPVRRAPILHCSLVDAPDTGFCDNLAAYTNNNCSCKEETQHVYIVTVNLTIASVSFSKMRFMVYWPSITNSINRVYTYTLPKVEESCPSLDDGDSLSIPIIIIIVVAVVIVVSLLITIIICVKCRKKDVTV